MTTPLTSKRHNAITTKEALLTVRALGSGREKRSSWTSQDNDASILFDLVVGGEPFLGLNGKKWEGSYFWEGCSPSCRRQIGVSTDQHESITHDRGCGRCTQSNLTKSKTTI